VNSPLPLRPRSATEIVDAAFQLYRRDALTYLVIAAICYAPILVVQLVVLGPAAQLDQRLSQLSAGFIGTMIIGYWISASLMTGMIIKQSSEDYLGRQAESSIAVRETIARLPAIMFAMLFKYILLMIGFLFFIFGSFYMMARYVGVTAAVMLEGRGAIEAMSRSAALSRGRKWHILGTTLLAFVIFIVLYFAVAIVGGIIGNTVIMTILTVMASILAYPMFALVEMLLYYDMRVRNEAYDIELMAEAI
jgi:hypothetical protein